MNPAIDAAAPAAKAMTSKLIEMTISPRVRTLNNLDLNIDCIIFGGEVTRLIVFL